MPTIQPAEFSIFLTVQQEFRAAVMIGDTETARLALAEIEGVWMNTEWPRLREAAASFLRRNAAYAEFYEFTA